MQIQKRHHNLHLDEDRFFDSDPSIRRAARAIYEQTRELPLLCPHGHVDASILAANSPFPEPTELLIVPDHYIFRMLYSRGVPLEKLGIPRSNGARADVDPKDVWQTFAEHWYLFRGTPTGAWLEHELQDLFDVRAKLDGSTASEIYDQIASKLKTPSFLPRALFERFGIEVLATTDAAYDPLESHRAIRESGWSGIVIPTFRPDALFRVALPEWRNELKKLSDAAGFDASNYPNFIRAIEERRAFFKAAGASATDHGVLEPYTERLSDAEAEKIFSSALSGKASPAQQRQFEAHMLMESARMSIEDGLVMQVHPGALRDHNDAIAREYGADKGADIPVATEYARNLRPLLNAYGNDTRLMLIVFTLDESTYARELAPLAGHYPALRLGPPWWFHDSIQGMIRYRESVTETAGIYNTAGFNDDTRAFCSIAARHDLARRVDANWLGGLVARHIIDETDAREMGRALAYDLARDAYRLDLVAHRAAPSRTSSGKESAA